MIGIEKKKMIEIEVEKNTKKNIRGLEKEKESIIKSTMIAKKGAIHLVNQVDLVQERDQIEKLKGLKVKIVTKNPLEEENLC